MTKLAILADLHGNPPARGAVTADLKGFDGDRFTRRHAKHEPDTQITFESMDEFIATTANWWEYSHLT